jgi:hypothetical protein
VTRSATGNAFDGMAENIQRLLQETAQKERMESEIAMARTIQHKLLPPPEAALGGLSFLAYFHPVDEIGGDYYDYLRMPDGRTALALGDVSGHGLPTGLLVAMKSAGDFDQGRPPGGGSSRLNGNDPPRTDPRHFMTLCLLAYDSATRKRRADQRGTAGSLPGLGRRGPGARATRASAQALSGRTYPTTTRLRRGPRESSTRTASGPPTPRTSRSATTTSRPF